MTAPAYRIDGQPVDPAHFYAAACDPGRSVVVEACAGAGKTWMLVSRILRALLAGTEPSQILAITFTRKAAGEMRERLDQWLREFAAPDCPEAERVAALVQRGLDAEAARRLAPALGDLHARLLRSGRPVGVQTFHGWFAQLLSGAPMAVLDRVGLSAGVQLLEDPDPWRGELMRDFHRAVDTDAALRADYLGLVRRHRRSTLLDWLDVAWQRRTEIEAAAAAGTLAASVPPPARDPAAAMADPAWRRALADLASALGARGKSTSDKAAAGLVDALAVDEPRLAFDLAWAALMTKQGQPRKGMGDLPAQASVSDALMALAQDWAQQDAHEDQGRMARLSLALGAAYGALKRRHGLADMGDLEQLGALLLTDATLSGWVQARLDLSLRQLLIDEFQDTSPLQWQALRQWLAGYAGAGGGASGQAPLGVFIVGDPKQSIYRFRRAEPRVFAAARDFVRDALDGRLLACDHTRRNAPELLSALNAVFGAAARDDAWPGFRPHTTDVPPGGGVWYLPDAEADDAGDGDRVPMAADGWRDSLTQPRDAPALRRSRHEADAVARAIAGQLAAGSCSAGEVMVLARRRSTLARVGEAMAGLGLPYTVPEALVLGDAPEAQDLIAVLDVLASPGHDLSLARALKSPLFGADDADLVWLAMAAQGDVGDRRGAQVARRSSWWAVLVGDTTGPEGPDLPSPALQRARRLLRAWSRAADALPPHDLLDRIVHEGEVLARLAAALPPHRRRAGLQAVDALLAAALQLDGGRYATPYGFVRALRRVGAAVRLPAPADAVQLLTVHGAKGLEARVVFLVDTDPGLRPGERATLLVDWPAASAAPDCVAFVASETRPPPSLAPLLAGEQSARARESLNGLYVAMTRARQTLVISRTAATAAADPRSWWARVYPSASVWTAAVAGADTGLGPTAAAPILVPAPAPAPRVAAAAPRPRPTAGAGSAAPLGRAVHRLLEWMARPHPPLPRADWPAAATAAVRAFQLPPTAAATALGIATAILDSAECAPFFDPARLAWAGNEVPVALQGQVLRIDRLVALREGDALTWWVLDYKLAGQPDADPALRQQLRAYRDAVTALQPTDAVRAAFITGQGQLLPLADAPG